MTAELAVEQAAGSLASERLSAETAERLRVERDLLGVKTANSTLQQVNLVMNYLFFVRIWFLTFMFWF